MGITKDIMTVREAAEYVGVSRQVIRRRIADGELDARPGIDRRTKVIRKADLDKLKAGR